MLKIWACKITTFLCNKITKKIFFQICVPYVKKVYFCTRKSSPGGGIGRHATLRGWWEYSRASSTLVLGTFDKNRKIVFRFFFFQTASHLISGFVVPVRMSSQTPIPRRPWSARAWGKLYRQACRSGWLTSRIGSYHLLSEPWWLAYCHCLNPLSCKGNRAHR